ncbi:calcium-independent phospholipase A2-gamma-like [Babylonia areolata]|uniref:calcium-independent phospholipase A2-gamma-like n=1 Tax=Babylonia areolata TaxID=304850 RepID=UPI003FCF4CD3
MGRVKELSKHIKQCPSCRHEATELKAVPLLLRLLDSEDMAMGQEALEALALLGYTAPVKGRGIRILCLDGGGTRALISILCLKQLERLTNRKVYELFDYVCGVSTGALLATIVFLYHIPLDECERLYQDFSRKMFSRSRVIGAGGLVWNYAFYDSDQWEHILQTEIGHKTMIEFARDPVVPKVAAVSTLINTPRMRNFVFRTYNFPPDVYSQYPGSCTDQLWEVIRASSAAPGYYEDFCLDNYVHSDGGLLANNPTALAIHESNLLWPHESLQCVVSLGTGRYEPSLELGTSTKVSLKEKVTKMVDNATDTEAVHIMMADVMPPNTYFRFNPYLSEDVPLDEIRPDRLEVMKRDTTMYLRKNDGKMRKAASILRHTRLPHQMVMDWAKLKADSLF